MQRQRSKECKRAAGSLQKSVREVDQALVGLARSIRKVEKYLPKDQIRVAMFLESSTMVLFDRLREVKGAALHVGGLHVDNPNGN